MSDGEATSGEVTEVVMQVESVAYSDRVKSNGIKYRLAHPGAITPSIPYAKISLHFSSHADPEWPHGSLVKVTFQKQGDT